MEKNFFEIKAPHLNANEEEMRIVELNFIDFEFVKKNQTICSIESSKVTQEIISDHEGYIKFYSSKDNYVKVDETIAIISKDLEYLKSLENSKKSINDIQITKKAQKLIEKHSIDLKVFKKLAKSFGERYSIKEG